MATTKSIQSRRFECALSSIDGITILTSMLEKDLGISFFQWTSDKIYIESKVKKTISYFTKQYPVLELLRTVGETSITEKDVIGKHGIPISAPNTRKNKDTQSTPEKLQKLFSHVRETKEIPDLNEDISAIVNKTEYGKVITAAKRKNRMDEYHITLRIWQKMVLAEIYNQEDRKILWVFDFDGNSGKTELSKYLRFKNCFQKLPSGTTIIIF